MIHLCVVKSLVLDNSLYVVGRKPESGQVVAISATMKFPAAQHILLFVVYKQNCTHMHIQQRWLKQLCMYTVIVTTPKKIHCVL